MDCHCADRCIFYPGTYSCSFVWDSGSLIDTPSITQSHYPHILDDGVMYRATCSCGWAGHWTEHRKDAELQWGAHGVKTIKRNANARSFSIIGNPLAKKEN